MKSYSIKFILFLVAFAVGTIAAFLFLQKKPPQLEVQNTVDFVQDNAPEQFQSNQSSLADSLSFNGVIRGCGNFIAYRATDDNTKVIAVKADKDSLKLSKKPKSFVIGADSSNFEVVLYDFGKNEFEGYGGLCFDAIRGDLEPVKLVATGGKAIISISSVSEHGFYSVTIILEDVSFQTPGNNSLNLERVEIKNAHVGWLPG